MFSVPNVLQLKIFLMILAVVSIVCIPIVIIGLSNAESTLVNEKHEHLKSLASSRSQQIERMLDIWVSNLHLVSSRTQLRLSIKQYTKKSEIKPLKKINRILKDAISNVPKMKHITIFSKQGTVIASTNQDLLKLKRDFSKFEKKGAVHGIRKGEKGKPLLSITSPMLLDNQFIGHVWSEVVLDDLYSITSDQTGLGHTGEVIIVGDSGGLGTVVLAPTRASPNISFNQGFSEQHKSFLQKIIDDPQDNNPDRETFDHRNNYVLYAKAKIPNIDWALMTKMDYSEVNEAVIQARNNMLIVLIIVLGISLVISYFISKNLTHKVRSVDNEIRSILETAGDAIFLIEKNGTLVSFNEAAEKLFGLNRRNVLGKPALNLTPPYARKIYDKVLKRIAENKVSLPIKQVEIWGVKSTNQKFRMELAISETQSGGDSKLVIVCRDVTQRRLAEMQMKSALDTHEKTIDLQRQFVSTASHEFRTPLAIISGSIQHLERSRKDITSDYLLSKTAKVRTAVDRINRLVESTLSLSRMNAGQFDLEISNCNSESLLKHICEYCQDTSGKHVITFVCQDMPETIKVDVGIFEQIISNLISNAIKYSPQSENIYVSAKSNQEYLEIIVEDEGIGIPAEDIPHLFGCFFRSSNVHGIPGTGIGLHIVKSFTEMHGGRIEVTSKEGVGSKFIVYFPIDGPQTDKHHMVSAA